MNQVLETLFENDINRPINFAVGDTVKVHYKIKEGNKERIQVYEGTVISLKNKKNDKTFTVRRISYDVGVERIFPLYSPRIAKIELVRKGKVRRAKLYYLRDRVGKMSRVKELKGGQAIVQAERKKQKEAEDKAKSTAESSAPQNS
ncbi:MAG: 50S ribosomal protein L19 [Leptospiraceae bacterium]|nr:50S ribosomal protein L19 [Leptospiraceae bacterium]